MLTYKSFSEDPGVFLRKKAFDFITIDLETRDSGALNKWHEDIISYAICFTQKQSINTTSLPYFHLFGEIIEDLAEEKQLLKSIYSFFTLFGNKCLVSGHNIALNLQCKQDWSDHHGYDFKKLLERGSRYNVNFEFLNTLECYDTINEAYYHYDHAITPRLLKSGETKRMLRSDEIEQDFQIIRPDMLPKLGPRIREIFDDKNQEKRLNLIMQYNMVDTVIEALITMIFQEQQERFNKISPQLPHHIFVPPIQIQTLEIFQFIHTI